jgi:hypothetical protein
MVERSSVGITDSFEQVYWVSLLMHSRGNWGGDEPEEFCTSLSSNKCLCWHINGRSIQYWSLFFYGFFFICSVFFFSFFIFYFVVV